MADDSNRGTRGRRWPVVVGALVGVLVLVCVGIVGWSVIDSDPVAAPGDVDAVTVPDTEPDGPEIEIGEGPGEDGQSRRIFTRELDSGVEVRASLGLSEEPELPGDQRPAWCRMAGWWDAQVITEETIAYGGGPLPVETPPRGFMTVSSSASGDDMVVVIGVVAPEGATLVRAAVPGGGIDQMEPVDRIAVLTAVVPGGAGDAQIAPGGFGDAVGAFAPPPAVDVQVQVVMEDGSVVDVPAQGDPGRPWWTPQEAPECQMVGPGGVVPPPEPVPPPTLPEPGDEQPDDPDAAEREITAAFESLYSLPESEDLARLAVIDDPTGVLAALETTRNSSLVEGLDGGISVTIDELVFTSAAEAQFRYTLRAGTFAFGDVFGRARLIDGVWKITRATYCADLARAGGVCGP